MANNLLSNQLVKYNILCKNYFILEYFIKYDKYRIIDVDFVTNSNIYYL